MLEWLDTLPPDRPVLIAGPTASGKSALALAVAERGGRIVNADALQVFADWRLLTARPSPAEEARAPHALYGHLPFEADYSVGAWLREAAPLLRDGPRPIVVGGTGLAFRALTEGLADIPATPPAIRAEAAARLRREGLPALVAELDPATRAGLDLSNPMRVTRAWEVARHTGRAIRDWQDETPPPLLPLARCEAVVLDAPAGWLDPRIARRFDAMLEAGVLAEVEAVLPRWDPGRPAARAIGAPELVAHLRGEATLAEARDRAVLASRRYAKRQRTWFRSRMAGWRRLDAAVLAGQ